jgi:hypothetical protein
METMNRFDLLDAAKQAVHDRGVEYGTPYDNHERIAVMWTAIMGVEFEPEQVALCLAAMKIARLSANRDHQDSWKDLAGYAATGSECLHERKFTDD